MSEPLGTYERTMFETWADKHFLRVPTGLWPIEKREDGEYKHGNVAVAWVAWQARARLIPTPATDQLNRDIRDVTSGKKEIVTKHPDSGGATCVCGHGQTDHSWVSANTLNPLEFTRDGYCLAKPCLCGTFTPAPEEP